MVDDIPKESMTSSGKLVTMPKLADRMGVGKSHISSPFFSLIHTANRIKNQEKVIFSSLNMEYFYEIFFKQSSKILESVYK